MAGRADESIEAIQHSLEILLRLSVSRRVQAQQLAAADIELTRTAFALLRQAHESGPLPMGDLARHAHLDPGATARQVAHLEEAGLLLRTPSDDDRRVSLVTVTRRGAAVRRRVQAVLEHHMRSVLDDWTERERADFARLLERFVGGLRERAYEPPSARRRAEV